MKTVRRRALAATAALMSVMAAGLITAAPASAALNCELWRSTDAGRTGFARCTQVDGYPKFQVRVTCSNGNRVYGPVVGLGQTTWATCSSSQGGAATISVLGKN